MAYGMHEYAYPARVVDGVSIIILLYVSTSPKPECILLSLNVSGLMTCDPSFCYTSSGTVIS